MKDVCYKVLVKLSEKAIKKSNNSACLFWSYQPKEPAGIRKFKA